MIGRYVLSPKAQGDIDEIFDWSVRRWGVDQAESYIRQLASHMEMIAQNPKIGRPCPEVREGYAKYPSGSHVLFYRRTGDGIDIIRILHARMDFNRHLGP